MNDYSSHVTYKNGKAHVHSGNRSFTVARRDAADGYLACPIEMVSAALGS